MGYRDERRWSEEFTRAKLVPFLREHESELPFTGLRITQDTEGWLAREIDVLGKADAVASRGGGLCLVAIRCSYSTGIDKRTLTVRWPSEYEGHVRSLSDPAVIGAAYMIHSYATGRLGDLICAYVAEVRRVVEAIDRSWDRQYETPHLLRAGADDQPFAHPSARACGALRLAPEAQATLFTPRLEAALAASRRWQATPAGQEWLRWSAERKAIRDA